MTNDEKRKIALEYIGELLAEAELRKLEILAGRVPKPEATTPEPIPSTSEEDEQDDLVPETEVLAIAECKSFPKTLRTWIEAGYFPPHFEKQGRTRMWLWDDILRWKTWKSQRPFRSSFKRWMDSSDNESFE